MTNNTTTAQESTVGCLQVVLDSDQFGPSIKKWLEELKKAPQDVTDADIENELRQKITHEGKEEYESTGIIVFRLNFANDKRTYVRIFNQQGEQVTNERVR